MAHLQSMRIQGYRPFRDFTASTGLLEVMVGANGSGKSSFFEFLQFLRDSLRQDIPPEIIAGAIGQELFHRPGPIKLSWHLGAFLGPSFPTIEYSGTILGPVGRGKVSEENVDAFSLENGNTQTLLKVNLEQGYIMDIDYISGKVGVEEFTKRTNQLALKGIFNLDRKELFALREFITNWRFYSSFNIANHKIQRPVPIEQEPILQEDAGNLSSVLHYLMTEHHPIFDDLQQHLRSAVPGCKGIIVKARGGRGEVMAFWQEKGVEGELSLTDLSDGILRLIGWMTLCVHPNPPTLICIDEPDLGVHPRTLPILAGLFDKASDRTQVFLTTHSSYFLTQFDLSRIAVFRKEDGEARFLKPKDSQALTQNLKDFGSEELEVMHRSDELERLA